MSEDEIREELAKVLKPWAVEAWLTWPNPLLDGKSPLHLIRTGEADRVKALVDALAEGVVF